MKAAVKLAILEARQEELRKELESYPSSTSRRPTVVRIPAKPHPTHEHVLQWQDPVISCVLQHNCEGHNVTAGYANRPAMLP